MNPIADFMDKAKGLTRNPLGIIALFVSLIYGFACLVLSTSINNFDGSCERLPLIWFIIIFPFSILIAFIYLVVKHHTKLYAPRDFKDERNFVNAYMGKFVTKDLDALTLQVKTLMDNNLGESLNNSLSKISEEIERIKEKSEIIPINNLWNLNHWGGSCARIVGEKMIFSDGVAPNGEDGCHIDLNNLLEIGKTYEISCFARSISNVNGAFRLWCHDNTGVLPIGTDVTTDFKSPSNDGEIFKVEFKADYNKNLRIHLQYKPGQGQIEVSEIRISEK